MQPGSAAVQASANIENASSTSVCACMRAWCSTQCWQLAPLDSQRGLQAQLTGAQQQRQAAEVRLRAAEDAHRAALDRRKKAEQQRLFARQQLESRQEHARMQARTCSSQIGVS